MSRPLRSTSKPTNNILLKLRVPRRTGRRRKRGTQDPFVDDGEHSPVTATDAPNSRQLLQRLRDNAGRYQVDVVGRVERTHVFRGLRSRHARHSFCCTSMLTGELGMPDFVYSTTASPFVSKFRETVLPFECM